MKKRQLFITILTFAIIIANINTAQITGKISSQGTNVSILVSSSPVINIISPENKTYITNESLILNYSSLNEDTIWYNIDQTSNQTISSSIRFNTTEGSHILYIYGNNSYGEKTAENVTFYVNLSLFTIIYDEYQGGQQGDLTEFILIPYEDMENKSEIILENTNYGKIKFLQPINLKNDSNPGDKVLNLDNNTNISYNRIEVDPTNIPNFNKPATIWLYNLTFNNPRILRDGDVCPPTICVFESYINGTLKFNVSNFTVYSAEESPITPPSVGGKEDRVKRFDIDINQFNISLRQGETIEKELTISNTGDKNLEFYLATSKLENLGLVNISHEKFDLRKGEEKTIIIRFEANKETIPKLYSDYLIIQANGHKKEIPVLLEIESERVMFDIETEISKEHLIARPGENLLFEVYSYNLGDKELELDLEYIIKDIKGRTIRIKKEKITLIDKLELRRNISLPLEIEEGEYILYVRGIHKKKVASGISPFRVRKIISPLAIKRKIISIVVTFIIIGLSVLILYELIKPFISKSKQKIDESTLFKKKMISKK